MTLPTKILVSDLREQAEQVSHDTASPMLVAATRLEQLELELSKLQSRAFVLDLDAKDAELTRLRAIVQRVRDECGPQLCAGRYECPCTLITAPTPEEIPHEDNCLYFAADKALNPNGATQ